MSINKCLKKDVANFPLEIKTLPNKIRFPLTHLELKMTKPTQTPNNQRSNALNPNRGTSGNNPTNAKTNGNRGAQLNPNKK